MNISRGMRMLVCAVVAAAVPAVSGAFDGQCLAPIDPGIEDEFGQVMVTGFFNGDRLEDLAVHAVHRAGSFENAPQSGTVTVYLRQSDGSLLFDREFSHNQSGADFGAALAAGRLAVLDEADPEFDRDALVIGIPGQDSEGGLANIGRVQILMRNDEGVWFSKRLYDQASPGVPGALEAEDAFGSALAVGDFDGDERADLAIGSPGEAVGALARAGSVTVLYGEDTGIDTVRTLQLHQDIADVPDSAEADDRFGASLAAGDSLRDNYDDLAVGVPREDLFNIVTGVHPDAGMVHLFAGSPDGLTLANNAVATGDTFPPLVVAENLRFGEALVMGQFRDDGGGLVSRESRGDLVIGVPGFSSSTRDQIGLVVVVYRSPDGFLDPGQPRQVILASDIADPGQEFDRFGASLAAGPLLPAAGRVHTLAIGAPYRSFGLGVDEIPSAGATYVIGSDADLGLQPENGTMLQALDSAPCGGPAQDAQFGRGLAILRASLVSPGRLAVGSPGLPRSAPDAGTQGAVELRGFGVFRDGFED